jgi:arsenite methyltransferase
MTDTILPLESLRRQVQDAYGAAARRVLATGEATACAPGGGCCGTGAPDISDPITRDLYAATDTAHLPSAAVLASLGCGNPTALAELRAGETVLDLGSGGGIDVLLSARRVGPNGRAIGIDMTDDMLALARANAAAAGATNVEFRRGHIEALPVDDASVDVIISNCVVNLSGDKDAVLREAFRVLKPGGRFAVSDVVLASPLPPEVLASAELWVGCVSGALTVQDFTDRLRAAGFEEATVEPTRVYNAHDARDLLAGAGLDAPALVEALDGQIMGAFIRARKPFEGQA